MTGSRSNLHTMVSKLQVSLRPRCAQGQGQGQRSRDTGTSVLARKSLLEDYLGYVELFIIRVKFAIYYFLHCNTVRQAAARLRAKSAIYDCLVADIIGMFSTEECSFYLHIPLPSAIRIFSQ